MVYLKGVQLWQGNELQKYNVRINYISDNYYPREEERAVEILNHITV